MSSTAAARRGVCGFRSQVWTKTFTFILTAIDSGASLDFCGTIYGVLGVMELSTGVPRSSARPDTAGWALLALRSCTCVGVFMEQHVRHRACRPHVCRCIALQQ
jgi:hypothetical protein